MVIWKAYFFVFRPRNGNTRRFTKGGEAGETEGALEILKRASSLIFSC